MVLKLYTYACYASVLSMLLVLTMSLFVNTHCFVTAVLRTPIYQLQLL